MRAYYEGALPCLTLACLRLLEYTSLSIRLRASPPLFNYGAVTGGDGALQQYRLNEWSRIRIRVEDRKFVCNHVCRPTTRSRCVSFLLPLQRFDSDPYHKNPHVPPVDSRSETHDQKSHAGTFLATAGKRRVANILPVLIFSTETRLSPGLTINLSSNNPFRNRAASPASLGSLPSPQSPRFDVTGSNTTNNHRPVSRNPFLDATDNDDTNIPPPSHLQNMHVANRAPSPPKPALMSHATELFVRHWFPFLANHIFSKPVLAILMTRNPCPTSATKIDSRWSIITNYHVAGQSRTQWQSSKRRYAAPNATPSTIQHQRWSIPATGKRPARYEREAWASGAPTYKIARGGTEVTKRWKAARPATRAGYLR